MFRRLEKGASFSEIAAWLNASGILPGPYCRSDRWDCAMVNRVVRNPILKGIRVRNKKMSRRINKTGRRRSVDAPPEERLERNCPHLAFIEPSRFDRVNDLLIGAMPGSSDGCTMGSIAGRTCRRRRRAGRASTWTAGSAIIHIAMAATARPTT